MPRPHIGERRRPADDHAEPGHRVEGPGHDPAVVAGRLGAGDRRQGRGGRVVGVEALAAGHHPARVGGDQRRGPWVGAARPREADARVRPERHHRPTRPMGHELEDEPATAVRAGDRRAHHVTGLGQRRRQEAEPLPFARCRRARAVGPSQDPARPRRPHPGGPSEHQHPVVGRGRAEGEAVEVGQGLEGPRPGAGPDVVAVGVHLAVVVVGRQRRRRRHEHLRPGPVEQERAEGAGRQVVDDGQRHPEGSVPDDELATPLGRRCPPPGHEGRFDQHRGPVAAQVDRSELMLGGPPGHGHRLVVLHRTVQGDEGAQAVGVVDVTAGVDGRAAVAADHRRARRAARDGDGVARGGRHQGVGPDRARRGGEQGQRRQRRQGRPGCGPRDQSPTSHVPRPP